MPGVDSTGFVKKTFEEVKADLEAEERTTISPALDLSATSVFGQLNGIFAGALAELWDVAAAVYSALYPDTAEGTALENVAAITGVLRKAATFSTVVIRCAGVNGTFLPAGRVVSVTGTGDKFQSDGDATIPGAGFIDVAFTAQVAGPIAAPAGTATTIETPVSGWNTANNTLDASLGADQESDAELRTRRQALLGNPGNTTVNAIRSKVSAVSGVTETFVFENTDSVTNADGVPAKAFEVVVSGGVNADIAEAIFEGKAAGIQAYGTTTVAVSDSQGTSHNIGFSRPTTVNIYVSLNVAVDRAIFGGGSEAAGIALVQQAITDAGDLNGIGDDVVALRIEAAALAVPGVKDVTNFKIDTANPPVLSANIVIGSRQLALFDTSRVTPVTVSTFVP